MAFRIYEWLSGYVRVQIVDDPFRSVLAQAATRKIRLWDIAIAKADSYAVSINLRDVKKLMQIARLSHAKAHFVRKSGVPFLLWRAKRRKMFLIGFMLFVAGLYMASSFIWKVQIEGTDQPEIVQAALNKMGLYQGSFIYRVLDQDAIQLALLDQLPSISWVGVRVQGTTIYVKIIPKVLPTNPVKKSPQDIVAKMSGVVASVLADSGQAVVKPGQYVMPGTTLISGRLEDGRTVTASGLVHGFVWYRSTVQMPVSTEIDTITGQKVTHDYLLLAGIPIQIWGFSHPPFQQETVQSVDRPIKIFGYTLPFIWQHDTVFETRIQKEQATEAQLRTKALHLVASDVLAHADTEAKIVRQSVLQSKLEHGKLYITIWTEILENIGRIQPIVAPSPIGLH